MVNAISNNTLIAALFGGGAAQPLRSTSGSSNNGSVQRTGSTNGHGQPVDTVDISASGEQAGKTQGAQEAKAAGAPKGLDGETQLTDKEQQQVKELKEGDAEVRRHESAHKAAAGSNATGGPTFEYTTGPDGKRYAVGGEVQIDTAAVDGDPQATIQKMQQIRRAALAPASPSGQDRAVAAKAAAAERSAQAELAEERRAQGTGTDDQQSGLTVAIGATGAADSANQTSKQNDVTTRPNITTKTTQGAERIGELLDILA